MSLEMQQSSPTLSAEQLAMLLEEVARMARANRPLALGLAELNLRSLRRLGRVAGRMAQRITAGEAPEQVIAAYAGRLGPQARAAMAAMANTGSIAPVLRLAENLRMRDRVRVQSLASLVYPVITATLAYLIVTLVIPTLVLNSAQSDVVTLHDSTAPAGSERYLQWSRLARDYFWLPPLPIIALVLLWPAIAWYRREPMTLPWLRSAARDDRWSVFCDTLAGYIEAGFPTDEAIAAAATVSGGRRFREAIAEECRAAAGAERTGRLPPLVAWLLRQHAATGGSQSTMSAAEWAAQWRMLAGWYRGEALRRSRAWIEWFPVAVTLAAGVIGIVPFIYFVLAPLWRSLGGFA